MTDLSTPLPAEAPAAVQAEASAGDARAERALEPEVQTVWRIAAGLWWSVFVLAAVTFDVVFLFRDRLLPPGVLTGVTLTLAALYVTLVPRWRYRFWRWSVAQDALFVEYGIVNRVRTLVPLQRVQHLDVSQNLLEREHDLGKLIVHTAGTQNHTVTLPGLRYDEAVALRDRLKRYLDTAPQ
jgi:membrane protein YdbS with pleckstrin-like domain